MRKLWQRIVRWFKKLLGDDNEWPVPPLPPPPVPAVLPPVRIEGTKLMRGDEQLRKMKSIDWAVQPVDLIGYQKVLEADYLAGIQVYFAYAGPGLGKPLYATNSAGQPYKNIDSLERNEAYWAEAVLRAKRANALGISVVVANTFVDEGVFSRYPLSLLKLDWARTVELFENEVESMMFLPMSEYDEGSDAEKQKSIELLSIRPDHPQSLHSVKSYPKMNVPNMDFICTQDWSEQALRDGLATGKPCGCVETQGASWNQMQQMYLKAQEIGAFFVFTGRNFGWKPGEAEWLKEQ